MKREYSFKLKDVRESIKPILRGEVTDIFLDVPPSVNTSKIWINFMSSVRASYRRAFEPFSMKSISITKCSQDYKMVRVRAVLNKKYTDEEIENGFLKQSTPTYKSKKERSKTKISKDKRKKEKDKQSRLHRAIITQMTQKIINLINEQYENHQNK